jgi:two-component system sensor histidine kinase UhpB
MKFYHWQNWSVSFRLMVITVMPIIITFSVIIVYSYAARLSEVNDDLKERGLNISTRLADGSEYSIISGNHSGIERTAREIILNDSSVLRVEILDTNHKSILNIEATSVPFMDNLHIFEAPIRRQRVPVSAFSVDNTPEVEKNNGSEPVAKDLSILAFVRVTMSPSSMINKQTHRFRIFLVIASFSLIVSLLLTHFLSRSLTKPIRKSIYALSKIREGDDSSMIDVSDGGEIGELQLSINAMATALQESRINLEQKICERTRALEISRNEALKSDAEKRKLIQKVTTAVEDERRHIAIEIHDELNAIVIAAKLDSQRILKIANTLEPSQEIEEIKEKARSITKTTLDLYKSARNLVRNLRPEVLEMLGLPEAINEMVSNYDQAHTSCTFSFEFSGDFSNLDSNLEITAYRLIQESLSNVVKHAQASVTSVSLCLRQELDQMEIIISDNGIGFSIEGLTPGLGIIGMKERVYAYRGDLKIESNVNKGTIITVMLPLVSRVT